MINKKFERMFCWFSFLNKFKERRTNDTEIWQKKEKCQRSGIFFFGIFEKHRVEVMALRWEEMPIIEKGKR